MDEYVAISELDVIDEIKQNDWLLLSRTNSATAEDIITSYKANAYEMQKNISSWVYLTLEPVWQAAYNGFKSEVSTSFNNHKAIVSNDLSTLSCNLTSEWYDLSTRLSSLCDTLCTEVSTFIVNAKVSVYNQMEWITNDYKNLSTHLSAIYDDMCGLSTKLMTWADNKFVTLSGDDIIRGNKTFTNDINGCALSARWI